MPARKCISIDRCTKSRITRRCDATVAVNETSEVRRFGYKRCFRGELQRVLCASCGSTDAELHDERDSKHRQPDVGRTVRYVSSVFF